MPDPLELLPALEQQAYRILVRFDRTRPDDLAELTGLPQAEATRLLWSLQARGLAAVQPGEESAFRPLPPDVALGNHLMRRHEALEQARQLVAELKDAYQAGVRRFKADHLVEVIVGREVLRERLQQLQDNAREEMLWFCRSNPVVLPSGENPAELDALRRGVRYQVIYDRQFLLVPGVLNNALAGIRLGQKARILPDLPVRIAIADRTTAICPLVRETDGGEPTAAVVGPSELLNAVTALFDAYWAAAIPLHGPGDRSASGPDAPDDAELHVLSLMLGGVPDKAIASQLGVSRRTVQRRIDRLIALACVSNRHGLAYHAARHGWL
ncbi:helix-turn-helix domain-containing protein [Catellatospora methionotrophica]|uniref:helix-turn-helix domain-containing protein n=1 Tax=Catellatospora methionotrophica TaxID=121620 RepID=UPI0033CDA220